MVRTDFQNWNQSLDDLLHEGTHAKHARTRERLLALYMIASGETNATHWADKTGRNDETLMSWVHKYNENGPKAIICRRTGGNLPLFAQSSQRNS